MGGRTLQFVDVEVLSMIAQGFLMIRIQDDSGGRHVNDICDGYWTPYYHYNVHNNLPLTDSLMYLCDKRTEWTVPTTSTYEY